MCDPSQHYAGSHILCSMPLYLLILHSSFLFSPYQSSLVKPFFRWPSSFPSVRWIPFKFFLPNANHPPYLQDQPVYTVGFPFLQNTTLISDKILEPNKIAMSFNTTGANVTESMLNYNRPDKKM